MTMRRFLFTATVLLATNVQAQSDADVTLHLTIQDANGRMMVPSPKMPVVVWLSPVGAGGQMDLTARPGAHASFQVVQKDKMFQPHLLVVPTGATVAFPNHDPFFHNVFSLFNGHRFDLGLYQSGTTHTVPFEREGISYIFCNIHSEMGAVIVSVATPYYAVASGAEVALHHVPAGEYVLKMWAEDATVASLEAASRRVRVSGPSVDAGASAIALQPRVPHTNKFGERYDGRREGTAY